MARERRNPEDRARATSKEITRIRRKYKTNLRTRKRYVNGEKEAISVNVAVLKIAGYSNTQIARVVGISRGQIAEILEDAGTQELLVDLRTNLGSAAIDLLQGYSIEAVQAIVNVLRASEDDNMVLKAAAEILDRAGVPKTSRREQQIETEERTTFTDDGIVDAIRQLPAEKQEEAAQMIEAFEQFLTESIGEIAGVAEEDDE